MIVATYESGGVVVTDGFGVTVGLQWRIGLDNLLLEGTRVFALRSLRLGSLVRNVGGVRNESEECDEVFGQNNDYFHGHRPQGLFGSV